MVQPATHLGCMVQPIAPRLQVYTAHYCTKQHEIKLSTRENDAIKRHGKPELYEEAGVTQHTVLQQTLFSK